MGKLKNLFRKLAGVDDNEGFEDEEFSNDYYLGDDGDDEYDGKTDEVVTDELAEDVEDYLDEPKTADEAEKETAEEIPAAPEKPIAPAPKKSGTPVAIKLMKIASHADGMSAVDELMAGNIVIMDVSGMERAELYRTVDFLSGSAYVLGSEMIRTNHGTLVVAPAGVDVNAFAAEQSAENYAEERAPEPTKPDPYGAVREESAAKRGGIFGSDSAEPLTSYRRESVI